MIDFMQRKQLFVTFVMVAAASVSIVRAQPPPVQTSTSAPPSIVGAWTLNNDLSDAGPAGRGSGDGQSGDDSGRRSGNGGGRRRGGGGFGGGGFGRGGG